MVGIFAVLLFQPVASLSNPSAENAGATNLLPLTDNRQPPFMGLYENVPKAGGIDQVDEYATWLNRSLVWGHGSQGWENWGSVEKSFWLIVPWSKWVAALPGRRVVLSVPLIPGTPKGEKPFTLKEGATGAYNSHFAQLAKMLVDHKLDNSIIRLGWEFDGSWYPWAARTPENAGYFAQCFKQVVTTMRAQPGAEKLTFCWNGCGEGLPFELAAAYPGDDCVDFVGLDIYDKTWAQDVYPYPPNASAAEKLERQTKAWAALCNGKFGIKAWLAFAKAHKKPFMIPEWGLWKTKDGHGGDDNPFFVQQMFTLIHDPENNVYEAAYWDAREAKVIPTGGTTSQYPKSAELFRNLFSLPAPAKP